MTIPSIVPAAVITVAAALAMSLAFLRSIGARRSEYLWLLALALPLSAVVNVAIKRPLIGGLAPISSEADVPGLSPFVLALILWVAPLTEEAVKVAPLIIGPLRRTVRDAGTALHAGLALGLGFGIGEAGYVAYRIAERPEYANVEWYLFTGYAAERLTACVIHGVLTATVVRGLIRETWRGRLGAYAAAVFLHALANIGPLLYQARVLSAEVAWLALVPVIIILGIVWERAHREADPVARRPVEELYRRSGQPPI